MSSVLTSIPQTTTTRSASSASTTSSNNNNNNNNNGQTALGPTIWYYIVALAIVSLLLSTVASRVFFMRRRRRLYRPGYALPQRPAGTATTLGDSRRSRRSDGVPTYRPDNGELESGLPTYCETTTPATYSYASGRPVGSHAVTLTDPLNGSRPVPADHPMYVGPAIPVGAFTRNEGELERRAFGMGLPQYTTATTATTTTTTMTGGHANTLSTGHGNATPDKSRDARTAQV